MTVPRSKITWTDYSGGDANVVLRGRTAGDCEMSPGCANCYAGAILRRSAKTPEHTTFSMKKLLRLTNARFEPGDTQFRRGPGSRPLVFLCDMGDLFHQAVPMSFIVDVLNALKRRADVDWQILTKRSGTMAWVASVYGWPDNVWAGVTVENQNAANQRIPHLLSVPAPVRFLSMEPLLDPVDLGAAGALPIMREADVVTVHSAAGFFRRPGRGWVRHDGNLHPWVNWVICGGESGPKRRPFDVAWAHDLAAQCAAAGVPYFFKQVGALRPGQLGDGPAVQQFPQTEQHDG